MTVYELRTHPLFGLCDQRQQLFLLTYLTCSGDIAQAIRVAYPKIGNLLKKSLELQKIDTVNALLAFIDGEERPNKDSLERLIWKAMRNSDRPYEVYRGAELLRRLQDEQPSPDKLRQQKLDQARKLDHGT